LELMSICSWMLQKSSSSRQKRELEGKRDHLTTSGLPSHDLPTLWHCRSHTALR
jgi:hypothetical protein